MTALRRTLVIGLGTTGRLIAQQLKEMLQKRYQCSPYVSFFVVDLADNIQGTSAFTHAEEIALTPTGIPEFVAQNPDIQKRIPPGVSIDYNPNSSDDMTHTRLGANLLLMREVPRFQRTLGVMVRRLFEPKAWAGAREQQFEAEQGTDVTVYIVASLAEPYGGGLALDAAYLVHGLPAFATDYTYSITGVFPLFGDAPGQSGANLYAALKEINHVMECKHYQNLYTSFSSDKRPFTRSCHLVEMTNEVKFDLGPQENGRGMICAWLDTMIFNPLEAETIDMRLDRNGSNFTRVPAYSSFGYAAYTVPVADIQEYYTGHLGEGLITQCLMAPAPPAELGQVFDEYWKTDQKLDRESVVGLNSRMAQETRVSLSVREQNEAALLFANAPADSREPASAAEVPLEDLRQRIEDEIQREETIYFKSYSDKVQKQADQKLIVDLQQSIDSRPWVLMESQFEGGVKLAGEFLQKLADALHAEYAALTGPDAQKVADEQKKLAQNYARAYAQGKAALINRPRPLVMIARIVQVLGLAALVILGLSLWVGYEASNDLTILLSVALAATLVPQGLLAIAGLGILCAGKYVADWVIGQRNVRINGGNMPTFGGVTLAVAVVPVIATVVTWLFYRTSESLQLPPLLQSLLVADYEDRVVKGLVLIAGLSIAHYTYCHWFDVHEMRRLAQEWCLSHDRLAVHRMQELHMAMGARFYTAAEDILRRHLQAVDEFAKILTQLCGDWSSQAQRVESAYAQTPSYIKHVIDFDRVKQIFSDTIADQALEYRQIFRNPRPSLSAWRNLRLPQIRTLLSEYTRVRFADYWKQNTIAELVAAGQQPLRSDLERGIGPLAEKNAKPFWSYYGVTQGSPKAFVGVGNRQEDQMLLDTFEGLSGTIGAIPAFLDTGDRHTVTCIAFRYDLPLYRLKTIEDRRNDYQAASSNPSLHVPIDPTVPLADLIP